MFEGKVSLGECDRMQVYQDSQNVRAAVSFLRAAAEKGTVSNQMVIECLEFVEACWPGIDRVLFDGWMNHRSSVDSCSIDVCVDDGEEVDCDF